MTIKCRPASYEWSKLMLSKMYKLPVFFDNFCGSSALLFVVLNRAFTMLDITLIG